MHLNQFLQSILLLLLCAIRTQAAYSASGHNVAVYWGQGGSDEKSLAEYCKTGTMDIVVLSFVSEFSGSNVKATFSKCSAGTGCTSMASDIKTCQSAGVKVMLSLGGGAGAYSVTGSSDASTLADTLYTKFGPKGTIFPGATIDGIDLDIEGGAHTGYTDLVKQLKSKFGKSFLISAAPQCVYPDAYLGDTLKNADIDMAFIQFYNNPCSLDKTFNWDTWATAVKSFANPNMKLYIGLPGSVPAAPAGGYVTPDEVSTKAKTAMASSQFGGFMIWDASRGSAMVNGKTFIAGIKSIAGGSTSSSSTSSNSFNSKNSSEKKSDDSSDSSDEVTTKTQTASPVTATTTKHVGGTAIAATVVSPGSTEDEVTSAALGTTQAAEVATPVASPYGTSLQTNVYWAVTTTAALPTLNTDIYWAATTRPAA